MRPKLREVKTQPYIHGNQRGILLSDPLGLSDKAVFIPQQLSLLLILMDGSRDIGTLKTGFELRTGMILSSSIVEQLLSELDSALLLDNERYIAEYEQALKNYRSVPSRPPTMPGKSCPSDAAELGIFLQRFLDQVENKCIDIDSKVKGLISPHIDFVRGSPVYAGVWKKVAPAITEAELVIIIGTDHAGGDGRITLTRQNYGTPWGVLMTAHDVVDEIVAVTGEEIFKDELHHRDEHSVEAAIIWLHHLLGGKKCAVLPMICGSYHNFIEKGTSPSQDAHIQAVVAALKMVVAERKSIVVAAADLAHIGPVFSDPYPVDLTGRAKLSAQDRSLMEIMAEGNAEAFYEEIRSEGDRRHICGMPPIHIMLSLLSDIKGKMTGYAQCPASEDGASLVSICGMVYI